MGVAAQNNTMMRQKSGETRCNSWRDDGKNRPSRDHRWWGPPILCHSDVLLLSVGLLELFWGLFERFFLVKRIYISQQRITQRNAYSLHLWVLSFVTRCETVKFPLSKMTGSRLPSSMLDMCQGCLEVFFFVLEKVGKTWRIYFPLGSGFCYRKGVAARHFFGGMIGWSSK